MPEPEIVVTAGDVECLARQILEAKGVSARKASVVAASLVAASLRGVDSHGVQLLPYYIEQLEWRDVNPEAEGHIVSENGCCLVYDGENGIGQFIAEVCCGHAIRLAREHGMAMVVARESNHFGAAAFWAQKMAAAGQVGIVMCNAAALVPPWQGKQARLGTNPICMALPGPWLLDMATTTVAAGKIYKASINGQETIPAGWAMDSEGVPTTSTSDALGGLLMPLGGYKGSGLAMMVELLCGCLSGGAMSFELGGIRMRGRKMRVSQMFMAIEIERFMPVSEFRSRAERLVQMVKATPPARGYEEVLVAGDPEWRNEAVRRCEGITVGAGTWQAMCNIAANLGITVPPASARQSA